MSSAAFDCARLTGYDEMRVREKNGKSRFRLYLRIDTPGHIFETAVTDSKTADADEFVWQRLCPIHEAIR
jgi:hypothetical protein